METEHFKGIRKVVMVNVVEGNGKDIPYREVHYIFDMEQHGGSYGGFVGKIDPHENGSIAQTANKDDR